MYSEADPAVAAALKLFNITPRNDSVLLADVNMKGRPLPVSN